MTLKPGECHEDKIKMTPELVNRLDAGESLTKIEMTPELIKRLEAGELFKVVVVVADPILHSSFGGAITYGFAMYGLFSIIRLVVQAWQ